MGYDDDLVMQHGIDWENDQDALHGEGPSWQVPLRFQLTDPVDGDPGSFTGPEPDPMDVHATPDEIRAHSEYMEMIREQYRVETAVVVPRWVKYRMRGWVA